MVMIAEQIILPVFITSCNEFLQPEKFEVMGEVVIEVAVFGVVTIAINYFAFKMVPIVSEFTFQYQTTVYRNRHFADSWPYGNIGLTSLVNFPINLFNPSSAPNSTPLNKRSPFEHSDDR